MQERLVKELGELLKADAENQHNQGRVMQKKAEYEKDPQEFVRTEFLPTEKTIGERGIWSVTTRSITWTPVMFARKRDLSF